MRNEPLSEGQRWLLQAQEDLKWARHLAEQGAWHIACFLSQQVAEKALKAFLYSRGEELVIGHSVVRLCLSAAEYHPDFSQKASSWNILDSFYIPTRYPNGLPDGIPADVYPKEVADNAVGLADEIVTYIGQFISLP
jgi:HEPN domain-containing protein